MQLAGFPVEQTAGSGGTSAAEIPLFAVTHGFKRYVELFHLFFSKGFIYGKSICVVYLGKSPVSLFISSLEAFSGISRIL